MTAKIDPFRTRKNRKEMKPVMQDRVHKRAVQERRKRFRLIQGGKREV